MEVSAAVTNKSPKFKGARTRDLTSRFLSTSGRVFPVGELFPCRGRWGAPPPCGPAVPRNAGAPKSSPHPEIQPSPQGKRQDTTQPAPTRSAQGRQASPVLALPGREQPRGTPRRKEGTCARSPLPARPCCRHLWNPHSPLKALIGLPGSPLPRSHPRCPRRDEPASFFVPQGSSPLQVTSAVQVSVSRTPETPRVRPVSHAASCHEEPPAPFLTPRAAAFATWPLS